LREGGPVRWNGAARESFKGPLTGPIVVPGTYTVEMTLGGRVLSQSVDVRPDPRVTFTSADYRAGHAFLSAQMQRFSAVDAALNRLDAVEHDARKRGLTALADRAHALRATLTADYHNDEDSIQRPGKVREDLQSLVGFRAGTGPPSAAVRNYAARVESEYDSAMRAVTAFFASDVATADAALRKAGNAPLAESEPVPPLDCATAGD
jgi:hypothetical protein